MAPSSSTPSSEPPADQQASRRPRLGLLGRLVLALVLVGLVPLTLIGAGHGLVSRSMTEQLLRSHSLAARSSAHQVESWLQSQRDVARTLARHPTVLEGPTSTETAELLSGLLQSRPEIAAASLVAQDGSELLAARRRDAPAVVDRLLEGEGSDELRWLVGDELDEAGPWVRLDEPLISSREGALRAAASGWLRLVLSGEGLRRLSQPVELGSSAELALLTASGEVLVGPRGLPARLPAELATAALSGRIAGAGGGDESMLAAWAPVAQAPWVTLSVQPRSEAEAVALQLRRRTLLALAGAVLLILLISAGAWASVIRPLRQLAVEQRELAGLAPTPVSSGSEIDELRASFHQLVDQVREGGNESSLGSLSLGRYRLERILGEGGMGTVFAAFDPRLERPLALKTVRLDRIDFEERGERAKTLLHEAVAIARIQHPNVVAVYDLVEHEDLAFLVMERVEGTTLQDLLDQRSTLPPGQVAALGAAVAAGLGAAHERELVHHDVKPGNILLGYLGEIKVVDFGISRFLSSVKESEGKVFGTPGYLAPEVLQGEPYTEAADLFALGVILYQCLVGRRPFSGASLRSVILGTIKDEPTPPRELRPEIPEALEALVLSLLEKSPQRRPPSAIFLAQSLDALIDIPWSFDPHEESSPSASSPSAASPSVSPDGPAEEPWRRHSRLVPAGHLAVGGADFS